jgi:hypothetical protein
VRNLASARPSKGETARSQTANEVQMAEPVGRRSFRIEGKRFRAISFSGGLDTFSHLGSCTPSSSARGRPCRAGRVSTGAINAAVLAGPAALPAGPVRSCGGFIDSHLARRTGPPPSSRAPLLRSTPPSAQAPQAPVQFKEAGRPRHAAAREPASSMPSTSCWARPDGAEPRARHPLRPGTSPPPPAPLAPGVGRFQERRAPGCSRWFSVAVAPASSAADQAAATRPRVERPLGSYHAAPFLGPVTEAWRGQHACSRERRSGCPAESCPSCSWPGWPGGPADPSHGLPSFVAAG